MKYNLTILKNNKTSTAMYLQKSVSKPELQYQSIQHVLFEFTQPLNNLTNKSVVNFFHNVQELDIFGFNCIYSKSKTFYLFLKPVRA